VEFGIAGILNQQNTPPTCPSEKAVPGRGPAVLTTARSQAVGEVGAAADEVFQELVVIMVVAHVVLKPQFSPLQ
jgi:hypothetical protein